MGTNGCQILPTSDRQVRPLVSLEPEQQRLAWQQAIEQAGGKILSSRIVQDTEKYSLILTISRNLENFLIF